MVPLGWHPRRKRPVASVAGEPDVFAYAFDESKRRLKGGAGRILDGDRLPLGGKLKPNQRRWERRFCQFEALKLLIWRD